MDTKPDEPDESAVVTGTRDRRGAVRVPVRATVSAVKRDRVVNGRIADLSVTGIFVNCEKSFDVGEAVLIEMCISELDAIYDIILGGTVARNAENGMGIHFNSLSGISRTQIADLVERLNK